MTALTSRLTRLLADKSGNFGATTAIIIPVLLGTAGVAMDYMNVSQQKNHLQDAADSAALAAASALAEKGISIEEAKALALNFLRGQMASAGGTANETGGNDGNSTDPNAPFSTTPQIQISQLPVNGTGKKYSVSVEVHYTVGISPFTKVLGLNDVEIAAASKTVSQTASMSALSMFLVLDKSGSMAWITDEKDTTKTSCPNYTASNWSKYPRLSASKPCYIPKIQALKTAVAAMTTQLKKADPDSKYSRLGAISYNLSAQTPSDLQWGSDAAQTYVDALEAEGGTASTGAIQAAYDRLMKSSETDAHLQKNGTNPEKFIVFMTDGDNNNGSDDTKTKAICDKAYKDKITVFTVAFMAPSGGQSLLKYCAKADANYFKADTMSELVSAFQAIGENAAKRATRLTN